MTKRYDRADLEAAYLAGFMVAGEGWNGEYPFDQKGLQPTADTYWIEVRDKEIAALVARKGGAG